MSRRNRPSAFDVSFPEEAASQPVASGSNPRTNLLSTDFSNDSNRKRKNGESEMDDNRISKRRQLPPVAYYDTQPEEIRETRHLAVAGEDFEDGYGSDDDDQGKEKPVRALTSFSIFDPKHRNEMVSLTVMEEDDGEHREFEAAGYVVLAFINEEDEGQEDGLDHVPQYIRLGSILRFTFDFTKESDPVYIETEFAWYILKAPSLRYQPYFQYFYASRRVAQLVISTAIARPQESYETFLDKFLLRVDTFGRTHQKDDLMDSISEIQTAVEGYENPQHLITTPIIKYLFRRAPNIPAYERRPRRQINTTQGPPPMKSILGNPDLAVLKPENQTPTHVTPSIASLARGFVTEQLIVLGPPPPPPPNKGTLAAQEEAAHKRLCRLITAAKVRRKNATWKQNDRYNPKSRYLKVIEINHETYRVGDFVIIPIGQSDKKPPPFLPENLADVPLKSAVADYFWFAKIIYIDAEIGKAHVHWLEHGSNTFLGELAHPQELFYDDTCTHVVFELIVGKVNVHEVTQGRAQPAIGPDDFFVKFVHNKNLSTFTSIDKRQNEIIKANPPYNCYTSQKFEEHESKRVPVLLKEKDGVAYGGHTYHFHDFVLYRSEDAGPAHIGYITDIRFPVRETATSSPKIYMRRVGRVNSILEAIPFDVIKDERHVFLTDEQVAVPIADLIRVCFVFPLKSIVDLEQWVALSPDHFYIRYKHPTLLVHAWEDLEKLPSHELPICKPCVEGELEDRRSTLEFLAYIQRHPLKSLDLFAGVGAFSHGLLQGSGCLKLTHAIEISPSAAATLRRNFPDAQVYNQCANTMLRYCIKRHGDHPTKPIKHLYDSKLPFPEYLKPGDIEVVVAGFPCQSHSDLNMYKRADDIKSNLVLTTLSWVDYMKPKIVYFENVPGFLRFSFDAEQAGKYKVEGGVPMGGMKFVVRALIDLGYQVRFGLLQAGNYGTPQGRVRLFIIAVLDGLPLPEFAQPSHDFPVTHNLTIKHPIDGESIRPIRTDRGTAPHAFVTIDDAIGDLPRFDWKHPTPSRVSAAKQREMRERAQVIPSLECKYGSPHCGYQGPANYYFNTKTTYQVTARANPTTDLQHFTRCLLPKKVARVVTIPLSANADYRALRPDQYEWQISNPLSSIARSNFRAGVYGRLDLNGYFPTTVTNVDPTAKQSKVLNPYCKRMVTVRELARSQGFPDNFVFESINNNVVTMHRQIGNAVPLPVGYALGRELRISLHRHWLKGLENAIQVDD
ncbi:S-adenosyl-L-methionine-dependent methyltransferase [Collybia nuda]|uniref:DNA (cytosine-5-)-methyltransferase n=1 Tax=Collybia nuda TaxID=64659 RepID=A0A9P6CR22_9AGAR|nr:S-adenosyl-L-methionine-dependent methyltransferase [Collybia nuda]